MNARLSLWIGVVVAACLAGNCLAIDEVFWSDLSPGVTSWNDPANWVPVDAAGNPVSPTRVPTADDDVRIIKTVKSDFSGTYDEWFATGGPGYYYGVDGFGGSPLTKSTYPEAVYGRNLSAPIIGPGVHAVCKNIQGTGRMEMNVNGGTLTIGNGEGLWSIAGISGIGEGTANVADGSVVVGTIGVGFGNSGTLKVSGGEIAAKNIGLGGGWGSGTMEMTGGVVTVSGQLKATWHKQGQGYIHLDGGVLHVGTLVMVDPNPSVDYIGCHMDIQKGVLIASGDQVATIQNYINQGWISAYDDNPLAALSLDYDITNPGQTTLKAILYASQQAKNPHPANNAANALPTPMLSWTPGFGAAQHKVYFGKSESDLQLVQTLPGDVNSYEPGTFEFGETRYWRIDECDSTGNVIAGGEGLVWTFTVANYFVVDDAESYTNWSPDTVWERWADGYTDPANGSTIGHDLGDAVDPGEYYVERADVNDGIVHSGNQSIPFYYDNSDQARSSQVVADTNMFEVGTDWTIGGVESLVLHFHGDPCNAPEQMYVIIEDEAGNSLRVPYDGDSNDIAKQTWHQWNIALQPFRDEGVDLANVAAVTLGFGDAEATGPSGASGVVFFDDIRLYPPRCRVEFKPTADIAGADGEPDCCVDYLDITAVAEDWLVRDYTLPAVEPNQPRAWYKLDETGIATNVTDSSGNGFNATLHPWTQLGRDSWDPAGRDGGCLNFEADKAFGVTVPASVFANLNKGITVTVWVNGGAQQPREDVIFYGETATGQRAIHCRCPWGDGEVTFITDSGTPHFTSFDAQPDEYKGQWNHYAFSKDTRTGVQQIYLNGKLRAENVGPTEQLIVELFEIGWKTDQSKKYVGKLDDFRVYDYQLSQAEVFHTMFQEGHYFGIDSAANLYDEEPVDSKSVNFMDFTVMADQWLVEQFWP